MSRLNETPVDYAKQYILPQLQKPLPEVYCNVQEFLWDFWPDMPWTPEFSAKVAQAILSNEEMRHIVRAFDVKHQIPDESRIEIGMMVYAMRNFDTPN